STVLNPLEINNCNDIGSARVDAIQPEMIPQKSETTVNSGIATIAASTLVAARYFSGLTADASIESICSVTFIDPSSAPIPAPTRPDATSAVMIGPVSLINEKTITVGRNPFAPKRIKLSRICNDITTPVAAPASAINGIEFAPTMSSWRMNSRNSNG